jgi:hypothetical protein
MAQLGASFLAQFKLANAQPRRLLFLCHREGHEAAGQSGGPPAGIKPVLRLSKADAVLSVAFGIRPDGSFARSIIGWGAEMGHFFPDPVLECR